MHQSHADRVDCLTTNARRVLHQSLMPLNGRPFCACLSLLQVSVRNASSVALSPGTLRAAESLPSAAKFWALFWRKQLCPLKIQYQGGTLMTTLTTGSLKLSLSPAATAPRARSRGQEAQFELGATDCSCSGSRMFSTLGASALQGSSVSVECRASRHGSGCGRTGRTWAEGQGSVLCTSQNWWCGTGRTA